MAFPVLYLNIDTAGVAFAEGPSIGGDNGYWLQTWPEYIVMYEILELFI